MMVSALLLGVVGDPSALVLLEKTIQAHGARRLANSTYAFEFRGDRIRMHRRDGVFCYERIETEADGETVTRLDNDGLVRWKDGVQRPAPDAAGRSLNSIVYFASLPYPLLDPAVHVEKRADQRIRGRAFHVLDVSFRRQGGGDDHEDTFRYWLDAESSLITFMAYRFSRDGGGVRFREATDYVTVGRVRFIQWKNFGVQDSTPPFDQVLKRWREGTLPLISVVELEHLRRIPDSADPDRAASEL
ncbi:MAG: DUF6503 family protein [Myxococcota bacterium]